MIFRRCWKLWTFGVASGGDDVGPFDFADHWTDLKMFKIVS